MPSIATAHQHHRTQTHLLINKLLDLRDNASPLTLILDSLEQSSRPLVSEYIRRAKLAKTKVVFVSFDTLNAPPGTDCFIRASEMSVTALLREITRVLSNNAPSKILLILSSLYTIMSTPGVNLTTYLSSFIQQGTSTLAIHHHDQPLPLQAAQAYSPPPLALLKYLATAIVTIHSLSHVLAERAAADRSIAAPTFGLRDVSANGDPVEGILQGQGANDARGVVVEVEARRKSGKAEDIRFVLELQNSAVTKASPVVLLEDHSLFQRQETRPEASGMHEGVDVTFNLGLNERQRRDREGVVLPYFDAQNENGGGEGGRILYDFGAEDDIDEDEDEI